MNIDFRHIFFGLLMLLAVASCADDPARGVSPEVGSGLRLMVPSAAGFETRAGTESEELKYTSLHLFAFPEDAGISPSVFSLPVDGQSLEIEDSYRAYAIDLKKGKYRFFLVANYFDKDAEKSELPASEAALKQYIIDSEQAPVDLGIPEKGLHMAAPHSDFFTKTSIGTVPMTDDYYDYDGKGLTLYSLLTFAYAKVTLTAMEADGTSSAIENGKFERISSTMPLLPTAGWNENQYGAKDVEVISSATRTDNQDSDDLLTPATYTYYIPERYVSAGSEASQTSLRLTIGDKEIELPLGETDGMEQGANALPSKADLRKIVRGTHYDYKVRTLDRIDLTVEEWNPSKIAASLFGPVFLHVERDEYEVSAGQETAIWVDSDATDLHVASPVYTDASGVEYDVFKYSIDERGDSIRVWLNPDIKKSDYEDIKNMNYLHIVAGPINKRIKIFPFNLDYYLYVEPQNIPIDVKTRIASGEYSGTIPVRIRTNYPSVKVVLKDGWDSMPSEEWGDELSTHPVKLLSENNQQVWNEEVESAVVGGALAYTIEFNGLNSGLKTWSKVSQLTFTVTGVDDMQDADNVKSELVTISVRPNLMNYIIHFRAKDQNWTAPHIYVYQCLEFPADWTQTYTDPVTGKTESLASKPVGHRGKTTGDAARYAALEYSFTGKIAFKGWDYPYNNEALYTEDGDLRPFFGSKEQGFFIFDDNTLSWVAEYVYGNQRYYDNMDFCIDHRNKIAATCALCANANYNNVWPGICMEDEGDGWWRFELTGTAVPGKALIMFKDGHRIESTTKRFPGDPRNQNAAVVGIPLFDFPDRAGWLDYNGIMDDRIKNVFTPEKPD